MPKRVLVAGATGAIGRRLVPLLIAEGYKVFGTTRSAAKAEGLREAGASPVVVDVFDGAMLHKQLQAIRPEIAIHQLTDLPPGLDPTLMDAALVRNAQLRRKGTANLVKAALAAGTRLMVAQSIAWAYALGPEPHGEDDPLDLAADGLRLVTVRGVAALEHAVLNSPPLMGIVLRYGFLYGPGTGADAPGGAAPLHVDAAAFAALLALRREKPGVFNIAEPNDYVSTARATRDLGWRPDYRLPATS